MRASQGSKLPESGFFGTWAARRRRAASTAAPSASARTASRWYIPDARSRRIRRELAPIRA